MEEGEEEEQGRSLGWNVDLANKLKTTNLQVSIRLLKTCHEIHYMITLSSPKTRFLPYIRKSKTKFGRTWNGSSIGTYRLSK
jgi:hypothetical protein